MRILFISCDYPSRSIGNTIRTYYFIKYLNSLYGHNITLLTLEETTDEERYDHELSKSCEAVIRICIPRLCSIMSDTRKILKFGVKNIFSPTAFKNIDRVFLSRYFSVEMIKKIDELLDANNYDLIFASESFMALYIPKSNSPIIVDVMDERLKELEEGIAIEKDLFRRIYLQSHYCRQKKWNDRIIKKDIRNWLVVSENDKTLIERRYLNVNVKTIPNGVDTEYFNPKEVNKTEDFPSFMFLGGMNYFPNIQSIIHFYKKIFPTIKEEIPEIKLFIVGRDPSNKILRLNKDGSVIVTGYVKDVRPYFSKSTVVIAPMIVGYGILNKILEGMSMAKPIVSTIIGAKGIEIPNNSSPFFIAKNNEEFANLTIHLLQDPASRKKMGRKAREFVENNYSWENRTKQLNKFMHEI